MLTEDGTSVFGFGVRGSGQFGRDNWMPKEVYVPVVSIVDHLWNSHRNTLCYSCLIILLLLDHSKKCLQEQPWVPY